MACTAGIASGCGVDSALRPINASSGLTADLTRDANQPVTALVTWQVKSSRPQPPAPGRATVTCEGDGETAGVIRPPGTSARSR
jgi:hypothetical protein